MIKKNNLRDSDFISNFPSTIFSNLFNLITSSQYHPNPPIILSHYTPPNLTEHDREMLKMILWYDLYLYLSNTFNINDKEENMFKPKLIRSLLIELIKDGDHTLKGIEHATHIPFDVLEDIMYEINLNPSTSVSTAIIGYYIIAKRQEYTEFIRKIFQWVEYHHIKVDNIQSKT